jgi:hypothetical protein
VSSHHTHKQKSSDRPHYLMRQAGASMSAASQLLELAACKTFTPIHSKNIRRLAELADAAGEHVRRISRTLEVAR